ncbi:MAG: glycosyltransferase family 4 protein [Acidimicrobiia bacterium]|nr:glycosyltransferase family 4 protein [Acidimicrobiia bacterium]NNL26791.1 glycosyltransferase family 4 protein [Acidimicrobiia bacterium]
MNILFVQWRYLPDVPTYCELTHEIASALVANGHAVTVVTGFPGYQNAYDGPTPPSRELKDGVEVYRIKPWFPGAIGFALAASWQMMRHRSTTDLVMTTSDPPVLGPWFVTNLAGLGIPVIQILQDVHPEAAITVGALKNGALVSLLRSMDRMTARRAAVTIVLSEDMADTYRSSRDPKDLRVINNFRLNTPSTPPPDELIDRSKRNATFAGNIGRFQNIDALLDTAALLLSDDDIAINLVGRGSEYDRVQRRIEAEGLHNVRLIPAVSREEAQWLIERSELAIVSLAPDVYRSSYPSKTMSYIDAHRPILAIVEEDSSLARDIVSHQLGTVSRPIPAEIAESIRLLLVQGAPLAQSSAFRKSETLKSWIDLIEEFNT